MARSHSLKDHKHLVIISVTTWDRSLRLWDIAIQTSCYNFSHNMRMARSHSLKDLSHVVTEIITRCLYGKISQPQRFVSCSDWNYNKMFVNLWGCEILPYKHLVIISVTTWDRSLRLWDLVIYTSCYNFSHYMKQIFEAVRSCHTNILL
jgi:WD40 repeat protein